MTPQQVGAVRDARVRRRPIDRAVRVAGFDAWCTAVFAALSLPFALFSAVAAVIGAGLAVIAAVGFVGRAMLRRLDPRGAGLLGANQLGFFTLLTIYCLWNIYHAVTQPLDLSPYVGQNPQLDDMLGGMDMQGMYQTVAIALYSGVILGSAAFQGGLALFYFSRARHVRRYLEQTPDWVRQIER